jgi:hypothetical protein
MLPMYWPMIVWLGTLEAAQDAMLRVTQGDKRVRARARK